MWARADDIYEVVSRTSFFLQRHAIFPTQFVEESRNFNKFAGFLCLTSLST